MTASSDNPLCARLTQNSKWPSLLTLGAMALARRWAK